MLNKTKILSMLTRYAGKSSFQLDERIGLGYILMLILKYGCMAIRGKILSFGKINIANDIFVGKRCKIICKKNVTIGHKARLQDGVFIDALSEKPGVIIGDGVILGRNTRIECTGTLSSLGKGIRIGNRSTFGNDCFFGSAGGIDIGEDVIAGQWIHFHSENHNYSDLSKLIREQGVSHKGIKIGNNCWIGSGAVFLDGAEVGEGCVVAAGAIVSGTFQPNSVIGGVPAKLIKMRESI